MTPQFGGVKGIQNNNMETPVIQEVKTGFVGMENHLTGNSVQQEPLPQPTNQQMVNQNNNGFISVNNNQDTSNVI